MGKNQHVVPHANGWAVRGAGNARATTVHHIGEIKDPIARGVISEADIKADFYDMAQGAYRRTSDDEITVAKNGGGAHLDLMTSAYILAMWRNR